MGFKLDRTYVLEFEGDLQGAIVKIGATPAGVLEELGAVTDEKELAALLSAHVLEWNLEDRTGEPIKTSTEAILGGLELVVMVAISREWYRAAAGVTAPLDVRSTSIAKDLEASLVMTLPELSSAP